MANPNNKHSFNLEGNMAGGNAFITKGFLVASQTKLSVGDPLVFVSGKVKLAGITSTALFGVCMSALTSQAGIKSVLVAPALPEYLFSAQVGSTVNITAGLFPKKWGIAGTTSGKIVLSTTATTSVINAIGIKPLSAAGTYAEVLFVINKSSYIGR